jgi:hypothetical protein
VFGVPGGSLLVRAVGVFKRSLTHAKPTEETSTAQAAGTIIKSAIDAKLNEAALTSEQILARLSDIAESDIGDFLSIGPRNTIGIDFAAAKKAGKMHLVKSYRKTKDGFSFELHNAQEALTTLAKYRRLTTDRIEVSGPDGSAVVTAYEGNLQSSSYGATPEEPPSC